LSRIILIASVKRLCEDQANRPEKYEYEDCVVDFISFVHLEAMFSFSKSLDNLLGASYLSGAAEAIKTV
jgi:hypothetical protein